MKKQTLALAAIIAVAVTLRFYDISDNPKAMYGDGLTLVYDAYSIGKTGHDQKGNFLPLVFSLGGGRPSGYVYATVPFAALLGPTQAAGVFVSALSGIGIVFLLYLLGKKFFSHKTALFIAALSAINPWELSLSRGPFESHFALFLTILGIYSYIRGGFWLIPWGLSFALAMQTYGTYKLTIPLLTIMLLLKAGKNFKKTLQRPVFIGALLIVVLSGILSIYLTLSRGKEDRFDIINIFKDPVLRSQISQKVQNERLLNTLPPNVTSLVHTPKIELAGVLAENYIRNFLPDFLFLHGDGQTRHNPAETGGFFWIEAVLIIWGITFLYRFKRNTLLLLAGWVLIAPAATSLVGGAHALRSSLMLPPLLIVSGVGLWRIFENRQNKPNAVLITVLGIFFAVQFFYFLDRFYFIAPKKHAVFWSYPAKEATDLAIRNRERFDFVILSNDIDNMEFAYPVYAKLDPEEVIRQNKSPAKIGEFNFFKYGNIYIGSLPNTRVMEFIKDLPGSVFYIGSSKEERFLENYNVIRGFDGNVDLSVAAKSAVPDLSPLQR